MAWGKKLVDKKKRANLGDFGRFQVKIAKQKVRAVPCFTAGAAVGLLWAVLALAGGNGAD